MSKIIKYNKLIRDRIPEIIEEAGKEYKIRELNDEEYLAKLKEKLQEEVDEYLESNEIEELADILEVIRALAAAHDTNMKNIEQIRTKKANKRGAFEKRLLLIESEE
jgi:predicted house-cleaning noncanonical NTP pyrophosphatase (MazG superfamily)